MSEAKGKKKRITVSVDSETYEEFVRLIEREGYLRAGDFLRAFIKRYVEQNRGGLSWTLGVKSDGSDVFLEGVINHIFEKVKGVLIDVFRGRC